jgi:hypothetical protein
MGSGSIFRLLIGRQRIVLFVKLANPIYIAVVSKSICAFDNAPKGFNFKVKKQLARSPKDVRCVETENIGTRTTFTFILGSGENYPFQIHTMMDGKEFVK